MFRNLSEKFKVLAKILIAFGLLEVVAGIIVFIYGIADDEGAITAIGLGLFILGLFAVFLLSLFIYAFGDVLDYLKTIADNSKHNITKQLNSVETGSNNSNNDIPEI